MTRLEKKLFRLVGRACKEHRLTEPGDRILVAVSGGKDSYAMLTLLRRVAEVVPFELSLVAVNLDQGHPGYPGHILADWLRDNGFEHRMLKQDTYSVVTDKIPVGKTYCSLCSRLRRGILYNAAVDLGATKIALGHHRDDVIETLMLNLLYAGQIKAMPARLRSDDGRNTIIRPLVYCAEEDLAEYAEEQGFPILPCDLCGSQENLQRKRVKRLLADLNAENPMVKHNVWAALHHIRPSHLYDADLRVAAGLDPVTAEAVEGYGDVYSSLTV